LLLNAPKALRNAKVVKKTCGIPFELKAHVPNKETRKTLDAIISGKEKLTGPFDSPKEMIKELAGDL